MAFKDCIDAIRKASGREMTLDEAQDIYEALESRIRSEVKKGLSRPDAARKAGKELSDEMKLAAALEKRTAAINAVRWEELGSRYVEGREADALVALVTGFQGKRGRSGAFANAGLSVDAMGHAAVERAFGGLVRDLESADLLKAVSRRSRDFEADIVREMHRLDPESATPATGNKAAEQVAKIFTKHLDAVRLEQNEAGAWIGKIEGYIGRQSHDSYKIRGNGTEAAFEAWRNVIEPRLAERTFEGMESAAERTSWLREVWKALGSGMHERPGAEDWMGYQGHASLAKKVSQDRKLHFASADAWMEYNREFGHGTVLDAIIHGIDNGARNAQVMRVLGTNPESMMDRLRGDWAQKAKDRGDLAQVSQISAEAGRNSKLLEIAMHRPMGVQNMSAANIMATIRNAMNFRLGGMMLSSFSDLANQVATARHNGVGVFESMADSLKGFLPGDSAARRQAAFELGTGLDSLRNSIVNKFTAWDGPQGSMSNLARTFFKLSGQNWWTSNMKEAMGMMTIKNVARHAGGDFEGLPPLMQTTLRRYGIEAEEWAAIRQAAQKSIDGDMILPPMSVLDLPDEAVAGLTSNLRNADAVRRDLYDKFSTYAIDQTREAMTEPTAMTRYLSTGGAQPAGSFWGEAARTVMQFKSFTVSHLIRNVARELFRDGVNGTGIATLVAGTTALGYLSYTLKDLAAGKNPRSMEDAGDYASAVVRAMAQGGGAGIYGDFLFGEYNKYGSSFAETLAGPVISEVAGLAKLVAQVRSGEGKAAMADAVKIAKQLPPASMMNLFYTRLAMDYFIFWRIQEAINPGYLRRFERNVERQNNQTFWLSPQGAAR
jgi:hypothetical protein